MREIKFRAWTENTWLTDTLKEKMLYDYQDTTLTEVYGFNSEELPVMQFTGLKDKNGKEIYEGDIVVLNSSHKVLKATFEPELRLVQWRVNSPTMDMLHIDYINSDRKIGLTFDNGMVDEIEVIGNIYEHSHLLDK